MPRSKKSRHQGPYVLFPVSLDPVGLQFLSCAAPVPHTLLSYNGGKVQNECSLHAACNTRLSQSELDTFDISTREEPMTHVSDADVTQDLLALVVRQSWTRTPPCRNRTIPIAHHRPPLVAGARAWARARAPAAPVVNQALWPRPPTPEVQPPVELAVAVTVILHCQHHSKQHPSWNSKLYRSYMLGAVVVGVFVLSGDAQ